MATLMGVDPVDQGSRDWTSSTVTRATLSLLGLMEQRITDMLAVRSYLKSQVSCGPTDDNHNNHHNYNNRCAIFLQDQDTEGASGKMELIPLLLRTSPPRTPPSIPVPSIQPPSTRYHANTPSRSSHETTTWITMLQ